MLSSLLEIIERKKSLWYYTSWYGKYTVNFFYNKLRVDSASEPDSSAIFCVTVLEVTNVALLLPAAVVRLLTISSVLLSVWLIEAILATIPLYWTMAGSCFPYRDCSINVPIWLKGWLFLARTIGFSCSWITFSSGAAITVPLRPLIEQ